MKANIAAIVGAVLFYFAVSMSLVLLNKSVLTNVGKGFPLFITWFQFVVALVLIQLSRMLLGSNAPKPLRFPPIEFKVDVAMKVAPVTAIFIGMVVFNNLCLKYVEVSFYQVARSLTILFSALFTYVILGKSTSFKAFSACLVVVFGFCIGSFGEVNFSMIGWLFGIVSSVFVALYGIFVKRAIDVLEGNKELLMIYNTLLSIMMLLPLVVLFGEVHVIMNDPEVFRLNTWLMFGLTGVFGFLINIASYLQISLTSPLTHNISGTVKACFQTVLGVLIYHNEISFLAGIGVFFVIGGSGLYSYIRKTEMDSNAKPELPVTAVDPASSK